MYLKLIKEKPTELINYYDKPYYVYISLSNLCNANCVFCDVRTNKEKKCNIDIIRLIDELHKLGTKYIHFTGGGEPFVNDDIFEYLEYCTKKGIFINLISNGLNLNEDKIKKLSNYNINAIFFSVDSHIAQIHDDLRGVNGIWNKVTSNINLIKKYLPNVKIIINHVLNKKNIDYFGDFINLKNKYNFDYINPIVIKDCDELFFTDEQIVNYNNNLQGYYDMAKQNNIQFLSDNIDFFCKNVNCFGDRKSNKDLRCVYPSFCAFVDSPTGYVYPCDCSIHRDRKIYKIGELKNESFEEIWYGDKRKELKKKLLNSELTCKLKCDEANCQFNKCYLKVKRRK
ncbi:MAG: radical SAM protein [Bacilli bacterium]|nr:radical SAM protein [Bacilli bacterium]